MPQQVNIGNKYIWHNVIKFVVLDEFEKVKFIMGYADNISDKRLALTLFFEILCPDRVKNKIRKVVPTIPRNKAVMLEEMGYRTTETEKLSQSTKKTKSPVVRREQKGAAACTELERCILSALDSSTAQSVDEITDEVNRKMHRSCSFPELLRTIMKLAAVGAVGICR